MKLTIVLALNFIDLQVGVSNDAFEHKSELRVNFFCTYCVIGSDRVVTFVLNNYK